MFASHLRRVYRTCDKIIVRTLRGRSSSLIPKGANPGLDNRIRAFQKEGVQISDNDAEEFVEQSESDFYKVGEAYNEHLNETLIGKYEVRHQIIKEKYFKENMPNLLTWSEKEQIRHLNNEHPEEWTPELLAESFPVTVPVVKKLLKYPWKPATEERIARHDSSVMRNWRELKEGSLDIPEELRQHFLKFSDRKIPPLKKESIKIDLTQQEKMGEFERIVRRCAGEAESKGLNREPSSDAGPESKPTFVKKDSKITTLDQLTTKIRNRLDKGKNIDMPDQIILDAVSVKDKEVLNNASLDLSLDTNEEKQVVKYEQTSDKNEKSIMDYPEKIRIPRNAYKKGATYKVNDCFYDHDGQILYRVLGMSNK